MIIERALTNGPEAAADLAGKRAAKQARRRGVALLSGLLHGQLPSTRLRS